MAIYHTALCFWIYFFALLNYVYGQVQLTSETLLVNENSSVTLTCTYTGNGVVQLFKWYEFIGPPGGTDDILLANIQTSTCQPFGTTPSDRHSYTCNSNHVMTWTIISFKKSDENIHWGCAVGISGGSGQAFSNGVYVKIRVPVTSIEITRPTTTTVTWRENTSQLFECKTSVSRPIPTISWYLDDDTTTDKIITDNVSQTPSPNGNVLQAAVGSLTYRPSRQVNGWKLYCSTQNINITSVRKLLNITYPPNSTRIDHYSNGSQFFMFSGKQQTLTCRSIDGYPQSTLTWSCFSGSNTDSTTGTTVSSQRRWTTNTGGQCTCTSTHLNGVQIYSLNVEILAAVSDVKFHISSTEVFGNVKVIHDSDTPIVCSASGTPTITYSWQNGTNIVVTDKQLNPKDIKQDGTYTCIANNVLKPTQGPQQQHNTSSSVDIIRLYPTTPKIRYKNGNGPVINGQFKVVKGQTFSLHCHAVSSPESTYTWNRGNSNNDLLTIAGLMDDVQVKCTSRTIMIPTVGTGTTQYRNKSVSIEVLKPPSKPSITYHYNSTAVRHDVNSIKVIMGKSFNISCSSTGKPSPTVTWLSGKTSDTRTFVSITKDDTGIYSCMAHNNMTTSFDGVVPGTSQNNISINVLYKPVVQDISDVTLVEGKSPGNPVICNVTRGYPSDMEIKWMRGNKKIISKNGQDTSLQLPLNSVNRNEDGTYECIAENRMDPTIGQLEVGKNSGQFKLTVYYYATITKFEESNNPGANEVTVMENVRTQLNCSLDSEPGSTISILKAHVLKAHGTLTNKLLYTMDKVTCLDTGTYTCIGYNDVIGQISRPAKTLNLHVRCGPRLSPINDTKLIQTSTLGATTAIQVYVLAYPPPTVEQLIWMKKTDSTWTVVKGDRMKNIVSTSGIITSSSLEIQNVQRSDFGEYHLLVRHEIFYTNITIFFNARDVPDAPTNLTVLPGTITDTSVVIQWNPGFNGGLTQTFVVMIWKIGSTQWTVYRVNDTYSDQQNITVSSLDFDAKYYAQVYAFNAEGNGALSKQTIAFKTFFGVSTRSSSDSVSMNTVVGASVGSVMGIAVIVVLTALFVRRVCRNTKHGNEDHLTKELTLSSLPTAATTNVMDQSDDTSLNERYESTQYEQLQDVNTADFYSSIRQDQRFNDNSKCDYINTTVEN